jgi:hypothetical protein
LNDTTARFGIVCCMANPEHLAKLREGVEIWNQWRDENPHAVPDLVGADLAQAQLAGVHLNAANLYRANLAEANLEAAVLRNADLQGADMLRALLRKANLSGTNLRGTNIRGADLYLTDLTAAHLRETILADIDLSNTVGLASCRHTGPSTIDHRTMAKSRHLPVAFLRGCGLPDKLIDYLPSLLNDAIQFYSCFISYSTKDQEFARRLYADLQNNGVRCWFAPHDIAGGRKVHEQIDEAIRVYDRLLLILSEHGMKSGWVETEISKARKREQREGRQMLFPLRLVDFATLRDWERFDADTGKDSAREIREYFIPDFSIWKDHDAYKVAFDRLLRDLKSKGEAQAKPT